MTFGGPIWFAAALIPMALLSDIFDGMIARRIGQVTELLRRADGWADNAFLLAYTLFAVLFFWQQFAPYKEWNIALALFWGLRALIDFIKYGRGSAYHFISAKIWGLSYYTLLFLLFLKQPVDAIISITLVLGAINTSEGLIATALIPRWIYDAPKLFDALRKGDVWPPHRKNTLRP